MTARSLLSAAAILAAMAGWAGAEEIGQAEYMETCAVCHGESGTGDGPLAELMTVPVPDLTQISAANDGVYPLLDMIMVIDGRTGIRGHGYPMPIWGSRFEAEMADVGAMASELAVRGRVLSLALYLESIQE
jgi:mono/diheme cytochrome c family protein